MQIDARHPLTESMCWRAIPQQEDISGNDRRRRLEFGGARNDGNMPCTSARRWRQRHLGRQPCPCAGMSPALDQHVGRRPNSHGPSRVSHKLEEGSVVVGHLTFIAWAGLPSSAAVSRPESENGVWLHLWFAGWAYDEWLALGPRGDGARPHLRVHVDDVWRLQHDRERHAELPSYKFLQAVLRDHCRVQKVLRTQM